MRNLDRILSDCTALHAMIAHTVAEEAADLRADLKAEMAEYEAAIPATDSMSPEALKMYERLDRLDYLAKQLDEVANAHLALAFAVDRAGPDRPLEWPANR